MNIFIFFNADLVNILMICLTASAISALALELPRLPRKFSIKDAF